MMVCLCKNVDKDTIVNAIKSGATTVEAVKEKTGAISGGCSGIRCKKRIEDLIEENK